MTTRGLLFFLVPSTVLALAACSTTSESNPGTIRDAAADKKGYVIPDSANVGPCTQVKACDGDPPATTAQCVVSFDAQFVSEAGDPVSGQTIYMCGQNICSPPLKTDSIGKVHADLCWYFINGAVKYLGGVDYVSFALKPPPDPTVAFPPLTLIPLPKVGVDFPSGGGGSVTSNGVAIALAAKTVVTFDPTEPNDVDLHRFRAVRMPLAKALPGTPANIEVLWGLSPVNAVVSPAAQLTVPNTQSWPANALVEFYLSGANGYDPAPPAPYGGWTSMGIGHVSADGATVSTDSGAGNGLPMVGIVGIRKP